MKNIKTIGVIAAGLVAALGLAGCSNETKTEELLVQSNGEAIEETVTERGDVFTGAYALSKVDGVDQALLDDEQFALVIDESGLISGQICNTFSAQIEEGTNKVGIGTSTKMFCEEPEGIMDVETLVLESLGGKIGHSDSGIILKGEKESHWTALDIIELEGQQS